MGLRRTGPAASCYVTSQSFEEVLKYAAQVHFLAIKVNGVALPAHSLHLQARAPVHFSLS